MSDNVIEFKPRSKIDFEKKAANRQLQYSDVLTDIFEIINNEYQYGFRDSAQVLVSAVTTLFGNVPTHNEEQRMGIEGIYIDLIGIMTHALNQCGLLSHDTLEKYNRTNVEIVGG